MHHRFGPLLAREFGAQRVVEVYVAIVAVSDVFGVNLAAAKLKHSEVAYRAMRLTAVHSQNRVRGVGVGAHDVYAVAADCSGKRCAALAATHRRVVGVVKPIHPWRYAKCVAGIGRSIDFSNG